MKKKNDEKKVTKKNYLTAKQKRNIQENKKENL